jgi:hypothetical protein
MNSWQVSSMMHLASTIRLNPNNENNFDATCNFLAGEVASLQTLNTSTTGANRSVAAVSTQPNPKSKSNAKSSGKSKDNPKKCKPNKGKFPKKAKKFNKDNPGAYVTAPSGRVCPKRNSKPLGTSAETRAFLLGMSPPSPLTKRKLPLMKLLKVATKTMISQLPVLPRIPPFR